MPAIASAIIKRASTIIQDQAFVRWKLPEWCLWLNDGLREMRIHKPALFTRTTSFPLVAGTRQQLPTNCERILRVIGNTRTQESDRRPRSTVTVVDQSLLSVVKPDWNDDRYKRQQVKHVIYDEADPRSFYVYPSNDGTGAITVVAVEPHVPVAASGADDAIESYDVPVPVDDVYANALVDYCLYRAYAKDAQFSANAERAAMFFAQFARAIGMQITQDANSSLNVRAGVAKSAPGVAQNA